MRSSTRTVTIDAPAEAVRSFLADPTNMPRWAPAFAEAVRPDGEGWIVQQGTTSLGLRVSTDPGRGTVDYHVAPPGGSERTVYGRVLPNGGGAEFLFTVFHSDSRSEDQVAAQAAEMEEELRRLRALCEGS